MSQAAKPLQSTGGRNRFLGISPSSGATYSVGMDDESGTMREWRPFICENALGAFPNSTFSFAHNRTKKITGPLTEAPDLLFTGLHNRVTDELARFRGTLKVTVAWQAVVEIVGGIARELMTRHGAGRVHGDVKPYNVLLTEDRIVLIDSFDVELGGISPGWTPGWSAPEQVLGRPLSPATDTYPLAVMLGRILGGELVGEVRKYRTPTVVPGQREFDIFHNPSLHLDTHDARISADGVRAWRRLVERGLRFDPESRSEPQQFATEIDNLAAEYPISGSCAFVPPGSLMATRLIDGTETVARVVVDHAGHSGWNSGYYTDSDDRTDVLLRSIPPIRPPFE